MFSVGIFISLGIGSVLLLAWLVCLFSGANRYEAYIEPLEDKQHPLKALYGIGFFILEKIDYKFDAMLDRRRIVQAKIIYGDKYGEYYYRVNVAQKITLGFTFLTAAFFMYPLTGEVAIMLFFILAAGLSVWYVDTRITDVMESREDQIMRDFPDVMSKLTLLINAGMIMREAWVEVAGTGDTLLYQEMQNTIDEMENGVSEIDAYMHFGTRCSLPRVKKFTSMLVQNLTKGNKELVSFLSQVTSEVWEEKKHHVKRKGEAASSKLMIPIGLMFVGIIVMIVVPVLSNFAGL